MRDVERGLAVVVVGLIHAHLENERVHLGREDAGLAEHDHAPVTERQRDALRMSLGGAPHAARFPVVRGVAHPQDRGRAGRNRERLTGERRHRVDALRRLAAARDRVLAEQPVRAAEDQLLVVPARVRVIVASVRLDPFRAKLEPRTRDPGFRVPVASARTIPAPMDSHQAPRPARERWSVVRRRVLLVVGTFAITSSAAWLVHAWVSSAEYYERVKAGGHGWRGRIHSASAELGLVPTPGAIGAEVLPIGPDVPNRISLAGYRIPVDGPDATARRPLVLALGCSYTYGATVLAEETFAWRVAETLQGTCHNAGICGGGAAQMLLLARERVPRERPEWVLVQYSPWLLERGRSPYAPTYVGRIPVPHFVGTQQGVQLVPPAFRTCVFELPFERYRDTARGTSDLIDFFWNAGLPACLHDDLGRSRSALSAALEPSRRPASDPEVAHAVYPEIARLCRENGSRMVIAWIDQQWLAGEREVPSVLAELDVPIARCSERLVAELPERTRREYLRAYSLVRGDPPRSIDPHPNARAHALIAEEILAAMGRR